MAVARWVLALAVSWWASLAAAQATPAPPAETLIPALAVIKGMPEADAKSAIAVHANTQGHWQFATLAGDVFTAGTPAELKRAAAAIAPDAADGFASRTLVLSQASLFAGAGVLKDLPVAKAMVVAVGDGFPGGALPVLRRAAGGLGVQVRSDVALEALDGVSFGEALSYFNRPLDGKKVRVFSLTVGAAAALPVVPKFDAATGTAALDLVEPDYLVAALKSVARQTVVLSGRIEGGALAMQPATGPLRRYDWGELVSAARAADVDLIALDVDPPLQPGGQNWAWQRMSVAGLDAARKRPTVADFINAIADGRGVLSVSAAVAGDQRFGLTARLARESGGLTGWLTTGWLKDAADVVSSQVSGQVLGALRPTGLAVSFVGAERRRQLDNSVFGWLPRWAVGVYAGALGLGLLARRMLRAWWRRIWPLEQASEYAGGRGYWLARVVRGLVFIAVFAPLAAVPGLVVSLKRLVASRAKVGAGDRVG